MKRILTFSLSALIFCSGLVSCQKELDFEDATGSGPVVPPPIPGGLNYQPVTKGSTWTYIDTAFKREFVITALGTKKTVSGKVYDVCSNIDPAQPGAECLFYYGNNEYSMRGLVGPANAALGDPEFFYLNDKEAVGYSYTRDMGAINGVPAKSTTKIIAKNISHTVLGKTYTNVIQTELVMEYDFGIAGTIKAATYNIFTAQGIGMIQVKSLIDLMGYKQTASTDLKTYSIK